jgi:hypothetical protein
VTKITKTPIVSWPQEMPCSSGSIIGQPRCPENLDRL